MPPAKKKLASRRRWSASEGARRRLGFAFEAGLNSSGGGSAGATEPRRELPPPPAPEGRPAPPPVGRLRAAGGCGKGARLPPGPELALASPS